MTELVQLHDYDPDWPTAFMRERDLVELAFPAPPLVIEHMGSTAIPGLPAKPIIDIIVLVETLDSGFDAIPALETTGYAYRADLPDKTKLFLLKSQTSTLRRTHHLHIHDDAEEVRRHLIFRDHLRGNPQARSAYLALKRDLAQRFGADREAYSRHKTAFIDALVLSLGGPARRADWGVQEATST